MTWRCETRCRSWLVLGSLATLALGGPAYAGETASPAVEPATAPSQEEAPAAAAGAEEASTSAPEHWYDRLDFKADLRLRYDGQRQDGSFDDGRRDRMRYRLRAGLESAVTRRVTVGFEVRSGDPEDPVSDNVTIGDGLTKDDFSIAEAYAEIEAADWVSVVLGKFSPGDWWVVSDLAWDGDVTVEGALEDFTLLEKKGPLSHLQASLYQYILDESSSSGDSYLFGGQMRAGFSLGTLSTLEVIAGYDDYERPQAIVDLSLSGELGGNDVTNVLDDDDRLVSDFEIGTLGLSWVRGRDGRWPVSASAFLYQNFGAQGIARDYDSSWLGRISVGRYDRVGAYELQYSYYDSEPDGVFYAFNQSDTEFASDLLAHRFRFRIGLPARSYINFTWYNTKAKRAASETMDRVFVDYVLRF